ncbi:MAG TPA: helix-turn-helix domain-containing protein, partial [Chloroflexaceae bacterium]|nr:helix-turn-helix domain-containing protein [Chloroflexaceae bacterium]
MLRSLWGEPPATHSPMQATGDEKYHQQRGEPNAELLRAHLRDDTTLAAPLVGADGLARAAAIDTDKGGQEPLRRLLAAATARGYSAFVIALTSDEHDGGHLWLRPFEDATDPARLRALCRLLLADAGLPLDTELWPNGPRGDIRLPFGLHVRCGRRGTLLLPDGEVFDLDTPEGLLGGLEAVSQLPLNDTARLPEPEPEPVVAPRPRRAEGTEPTRIEELNQAGPEELAALLVEHFGCRIARTVPSGIMLHCGCDKHANGDRKPSLRVYQGRNGKALVSSYSPACKWRGAKHGATDYAAVYCEAHGLTYRDLAAPSDAARRHTDPAELARRSAEAERKRRARAQAAADTLQAVRDRAAEDTSLAPGTAGYKVLHALLEIAGAKDWCRPSVARLVEQVGCSERTVQRALAYLEGRYLTTEERTTDDGTPWRGGPNTAKRTFLRAPLQPVPTPQSEQGGVTRPVEPAEPVAPVIDNKLVLDSYPVACKGGVP